MINNISIVNKLYFIKRYTSVATTLIIGFVDIASRALVHVTEIIFENVVKLATELVFSDPPKTSASNFAIKNIVGRLFVLGLVK